MSRVAGPIDARLLHTTRQDSLLQERLLLDGVDVQSSADMPRDVAMERPHARVVGVVLQHDVPGRARSARLHNLYVATLSVGLVDDFAVPGPHALGQDVEIMSVDMNGVGGRELVLDDDPDGDFFN